MKRLILLTSLFFLLNSTTVAQSLEHANSPAQTELKQEIEIDPAYQENANDDDEVKLQKEKIRAAIEDVAVKRDRARQGQDGVFFLFESQKRLATAMLDFHKDPKKIIEVLEQQVQITREVEKERKLRFENGVGRPDEYNSARYFRADAELQLLRAKRKFKMLDDKR